MRLHQNHARGSTRIPCLDNLLFDPARLDPNSEPTDRFGSVLSLRRHQDAASLASSKGCIMTVSCPVAAFMSAISPGAFLRRVKRLTIRGGRWSAKPRNVLRHNTRARRRVCYFVPRRSGGLGARPGSVDPSIGSLPSKSHHQDQESFDP